MSKAKKKGPLPCWARVNKVLEARNAELDMATTITIGSAEMGTSLYIPLRKINSRKPGLTKLAPVHCPFCGEKLDE